MSQNSLVLPTSGTLSGLAAVQGINAALDTLNTCASGGSAPSAPEAGQLWHDTANKVLKIRSMDNTAWIALGALDETNYLFTAASAATATSATTAATAGGLSGTLPVASGGTGATTTAAALTALLAGSVISPANGGTGQSSVAALYSFYRGQNGYEASPSGRITQWGLSGVIGGGGNSANIVFPIEFPNTVLNLVVSSFVGAGATNGPSYANLNPSGFTAFNNCTNANAQISWHAEGY